MTLAREVQADVALFGSIDAPRVDVQGRIRAFVAGRSGHARTL